MDTWAEVAGSSTGRRTSPAAVTIGTFDGVHRGHQHLLARTREVADGLPVVAVTFEPHPLAVTRPDRAPVLLTTVERRVELLHEHGADEVRVLGFTAEMAAWSPAEFVDRALVEDLEARHVVVGESFRFGARAAGDTDFLREHCARLGVSAEPLTLLRDGEFSSTQVRRHVAAGDLLAAARVLGRPHEVSGTVTPGDQRGRDLGYPTANVPVDERFAVPPDGVYAGRLVVAGTRYPAAVSIGTNPTFDGTQRRVESYVMDHGHDLDLYGLDARVELVEQVRPMASFDSVDALVVQMRDDVEAVRAVLAR
ncbi:bifunctional riboflavin kinase/FAD synthetase [Aeromicrobium halocynthiae]|uniref:Riboflavin biosynthesis protein n=1 Tax=Aeromicrobium halocynthiae TaxID=560557 RepID=A0ABN2W171_9ACTN